MDDRHFLTWAQVEADVDALLDRVTLPTDLTGVYGIPRGGVPVGLMIARRLGLPMVDDATEAERALVVDDLIDSGRTLEGWLSQAYPCLTVYRKPGAPKTGVPAIDVGATELPDVWTVFPWESHKEADGPTDAVVRLLEFVGEDPNRPGLLDTPQRVLRAMAEMTGGASINPADVLARRFDDTCDEMVVVDGIQFVSLCEHHLLAFAGTATVAYVPNGQVVGLSKIPRLVDALARRLQVQERLTEQIADAMVEHLAPLGVGVVLRSSHSCMGHRGVRQPGASMTTSALRGVLRDRPEARAEFMAIAHLGSR